MASPTFVFAGASLGGESINECNECGALCRGDRGVALHTAWHEEQDAEPTGVDKVVDTGACDPESDTHVLPHVGCVLR